jgi:hypothetical protein
MYNYEECISCKQRMRDFRARQIQKQKRQFIFMMAVMVLVFGYLIWQVNRNIENDLAREVEVRTVYKPIFTQVSAEPTPIVIEEDKVGVQPDKEMYAYNPMELPSKTKGEFKTYMDYRKIKDKTSKQWNLQQLATTNEKGFRVFNGRYLVAVGSYYANEVGKELKITLDNGFVFYAMVGDIKMDIHTDANNQYVPINGNIVEFIVDTDKLDPLTKKLGDVSNSGLEGKIVMIEEVIAYGE